MEGSQPGFRVTRLIWPPASPASPGPRPCFRVTRVARLHSQRPARAQAAARPHLWLAGVGPRQPKGFRVSRLARIHSPRQGPGFTRLGKAVPRLHSLRPSRRQASQTGISGGWESLRISQAGLPSHSPHWATDGIAGIAGEAARTRLHSPLPASIAPVGRGRGQTSVACARAAVTCR